MGREPGCWVCSVGNFQLRKDSKEADSAVRDSEEGAHSSRGHSTLTLTGCTEQTCQPLWSLAEAEAPGVLPRSNNSLLTGGHTGERWREH